MAAPFSDLEVAPKASDLEVAQNPPFNYQHKYDQAGLEYARIGPNSPGPNSTEPHLESHKEAIDPPPPQRRRICGLTPRIFWIIAIALIVVVIGAAVGAGVGKSLASKSNNITGATPTPGSPIQLSSMSSTSSTSSIRSTNSNTPLSSGGSTDSNTPSPTSRSTVAFTTTQVIGPKYTLQRDCPSTNNSLYSITLGSLSMNFRKICEKSYLNSQSIQSSINVPTSNLDSCINLCAAWNVQKASSIASGQDSVCNAVCWRNGVYPNDFPGQCFGFTTQNSSNAFVVQDERECDSAAWIDQKFL